MNFFVSRIVVNISVILLLLVQIGGSQHVRINVSHAQLSGVREMSGISLITQ